jgi:hypothetical protein
MSLLRSARHEQAARFFQSLQYDTHYTLMQYVGYEMVQHGQNQNVASCIINRVQYSTSKLDRYLETISDSVRALISTVFNGVTAF